MRSRPIRMTVLSLIPLTAFLVVTTSCAQWHAHEAQPQVVSQGDHDELIVITADRRDALSREQAIAITSFNTEALEPN